jgi:hypothetical protein
LREIDITHRSRRKRAELHQSDSFISHIRISTCVSQLEKLIVRSVSLYLFLCDFSSGYARIPKRGNPAVKPLSTRRTIADINLKAIDHYNHGLGTLNPASHRRSRSTYCKADLPEGYPPRRRNGPSVLTSHPPKLLYSAGASNRKTHPRIE